MRDVSHPYTTAGKIVSCNDYLYTLGGKRRFFYMMIISIHSCWNDTLHFVRTLKDLLALRTWLCVIQLSLFIMYRIMLCGAFSWKCLIIHFTWDLKKLTGCTHTVTCGPVYRNYVCTDIRYRHLQGRTQTLLCVTVVTSTTLLIPKSSPAWEANRNHI